MRLRDDDFEDEQSEQIPAESEEESDEPQLDEEPLQIPTGDDDEVESELEGFFEEDTGGESGESLED